MTFPSAAWMMAKPLVSKGGVLLLDTFTDGDATSLDAHTPDIDSVGGGWSIINGTNQIISNASEPSVGGAWGQSLIDVGASDFVITCTPTFTGEGDFKLYFRAIDDQDFVMLGIDNYAEGNFTIAKRVGGSFSNVEVDVPDPSGFYGARTIDLRATVIGNQITVEDLTDGLIIGPTTVDDHVGETLIGFGDSGGDAQWSLDDLQVVAL